MISVVPHINSYFSSITYIIQNEGYDYICLIDCGDADALIHWLEVNHKTLKGIFLTHTHYDHIYGLNKLKEIYPHCSVYTSVNGVKGLYSPQWNMSRYMEIGDYVYQHHAVNELGERDKVELWPGVFLETIETPGHDWSCLTYKVDIYLFTGDSYIPGVKTITNLPKSNKKEAEISLKRIMQLKKSDNFMICPGHAQNQG
jgi:glyoxylase-like metal-dependent hydrolase (beta-lactamase superfamily II)